MTSLPGISTNRAAPKWTSRELVLRAVWEILRGPLFTLSPRVFWGWRRGILRLFGAKIGSQAHIFPSARIAIPWNLEIGDQSSIGDGAVIYNLGTIRIGRAATVSQYAHLCAGTHDFRQTDMPLIKSKIEIGDGAWVCADAFIGPDVRIGEMAVVGARAVAMRDVPPYKIVAGNPARVIGARDAEA